jgi:hypothetical protein
MGLKKATQIECGVSNCFGNFTGLVIRLMLMDTSATSIKRNKNRSKRPELSTIQKLYARIMELLSRKTDAEKRVGLYGKDPFK